MRETVSEKQYRDKIAAIKKQQGTLETALTKARTAATRHRSDAAKQLAKITPRTSDSMARMYQRAAEAAEKRATTEDGKVANLSTKRGRLASDLAAAQAGLDREVKATARRNENAPKAAARRTEQEDARRRQAEKRHAQEIARIAQPIVRYVHEVRTLPPPKPEVLRVLYRTANPEMDLRTEVEVRDVQQAVRAATHRDLIEITYKARCHPRGSPRRPQRHPPPRRAPLQPCRCSSRCLRQRQHRHPRGSGGHLRPACQGARGYR
jgi:hypothetical protein